MTDQEFDHMHRLLFEMIWNEFDDIVDGIAARLPGVIPLATRQEVTRERLGVAAEASDHMPLRAWDRKELEQAWSNEDGRLTMMHRMCCDAEDDLSQIWLLRERIAAALPASLSEAARREAARGEVAYRVANGN